MPEEPLFKSEESTQPTAEIPKPFVNELDERMSRVKGETIEGFPFILMLKLLMNDRRNYFIPDDYENHIEKDWICVPEYLAKIIAAKDPYEILTHVEFPGQFNEKPWPQVWNIQAWKASLNLLEKRAAEFEDRRAKQALREQKIKELTEACKRDAGMEEKAAKMFANMIVWNLSVDVAKQFGVDISNVDASVTTRVHKVIADFR